MAAEYLSSWSPAAIVATNTALLALIESGAGAPSITLHNASDTLLITIPLADPAGSVDGVTGALTLNQDMSGPPTVEAGIVAQDADYGSLRTGSGNVIRSFPCVTGTVAINNMIVLEEKNLNEGDSITLTTMVIT